LNRLRFFYVSGAAPAAQAAQRLQQYGLTSLATHRVSAVALLVRQIKNPILLLLLGAALVSGLTGGGTNAGHHWGDRRFECGSGLLQRISIAIASLRGRIRHDPEVERDGRTARIPVTELVPADVVTLRIGELAPADVCPLDPQELGCDEGVLTGESLPVEQSAQPSTVREPLDHPGAHSWAPSSTTGRVAALS
jgi:Mg2+-importing ATPase